MDQLKAISGKVKFCVPMTERVAGIPHSKANSI